MSYSPVKFQPVTFDLSPTDCRSESPIKYGQLIDVTEDTTQFQLRVSNCEDTPNKIRNGQFVNATEWAFGTDWKLQSGLARRISGPLTSLVQLGAFVEDSYYCVRVVIEDNEFSGSFTLFLSDESRTISAPGTYEYYFTAGASDVIAVTPGDLDNTININSIEAFRITSNLIVSIWDIDNVYQAQISQIDTPSAFVFAGNSLTVDVDWEALGLTSGCYYVCIHDPCLNTNGQNGLFNGDFEYPTAGPDDGYTITVNPVGVGQIINQEARFQNSDPTATEAIFLNDKTTLQDGLSYNITWELIAATNTSVAILIGANSGVARLTAGVYTDTIIADGTELSIRMLQLPILGLKTGIVKNVVLSLTNPEDLVCDVQSNNFRLGTWPCSIKLSGCPVNNAYGMTFEGSDFRPSLRFEGRLMNADNPYETNSRDYISAAGVSTNNYHNVRESFTLTFTREPKFVHSFVSILKGFDDLTINGDSYAIKDSEFPTIRYYNNREFGRFEIAVEKREQLYEKVSILNQKIVASLVDTIVDPVSGESIIDPVSGEPLIL